MLSPGPYQVDTLKANHFHPHPAHRVRVSSDGQVMGPSGGVLRQFPGKDGRLRITQYLGEGRWQQFSVHVLICEVFHGPRPPGAHAAHHNGDYLDNHASNLAWKTPVENAADKVIHGTVARGEGHGRHKITEDDVRAIRQARAGDPPTALRELAQAHGISTSLVSLITLRKIWKHVQ